MEHYRTEYRDELFTDTGGVRTNKGDKILFNAGLPENLLNKNRSFPVWIKAIIQKSSEDQVWLEKVEVLGGFKSKSRSDLVTEHTDAITNRFRGNRPVRLTRSETWFVFPPSKKTGVSDYISKHGHEALAAALGFPQEEKRRIRPEDNPEMQLVSKQNILNGFQAAEVDEQAQEASMVIIEEAMFNPQERALTTTGIMNQFEAETPSDDKVSAVLYAVNVLSSIIGFTVKGVPTPDGMSGAWNEASSKQKAAFLATFRVMKDYLTKLRSDLDQLFSTEGKSSTLMTNIGFVFDKLTTMSKTPPPGSQEKDSQPVLQQVPVLVQEGTGNEAVETVIETSRLKKE